jgi:energy-coupling factor transport system permease protein
MLGWVAAVLFAAMLLQHPLWLAGVFVVTAAMAWRARVTREWAALMRYVAFMAVAIVAINALVSQQGSHVLLEAGFRLPLVGMPRLTVEALAFGGAMALRLAAIISAFTLLNLCVHPDDLMRAAIKLKLPYRSVLVTSLSTRFIPVLMADARTVVDVQRSRGLSFDRGNLLERIRNAGALIFPMLSNSLDRAVQVAEAMEARAYGASVQRTFYRDRPLRAGDTFLLVALLAGTTLVVVAHGAGIGDYQYYPTLGSMEMTLTEWLALGVFLATLFSVAVAHNTEGEER